MSHPKAPNIIYLQDGSSDDVDRNPFEDCDGVTWCQDEINEGDSKYILFDDYKKLETEAERLKEALDPFVRLAHIMEALNLPDSYPIAGCCPGEWPTLGDCREARAALEPK